MGVDADKVVADPERSIEAGALAALAGPGSHRYRMVKTLADAMGFALTTPWSEAAGGRAPGDPPRQRARAHLRR